jgi:hypothetical protein
MINDFHFIDFAMAFNTTDTSIHMHGMVKVYIVWDLMDPYPRDRLT